LIYNDGTNSDQTLAAYKTRVSTRDNVSVTENLTSSPTFTSTSCGNAGFLHILTTLATQTESAGSPVAGISDDFDGDLRNATTPDIGADEFAGLVSDLTAPVIAYTTLANGNCTGVRTFTATVVDAISGVNTTSGTLPRVYYKKATNANSLGATNDNTTDGWKFTEATNTSSPFNFALNGGLIFGGLTSGEVVQYFVVGQDLAATPNVGINSGTFAATPSSVALTGSAFPIGGTINSYTITSTVLSASITASPTTICFSDLLLLQRFL